ncbi:MAG TPA: metallophosphoesterase [Solirubrobacteraceae bacterium]|nr:metallophosphoesterase [Solirubrobacteraceae bacterium]
MRRAAALLAGAAAVALARAAWWEPRRLDVPEHELRLPSWPRRLDGLRVALVSDLHTGAPGAGLDRTGEVVARVRAARPDLIALLGDFVDPTVVGARPVAPADVAARLAGLSAPVGVVAVLGNHDWSHTGHGMAQALRDAGVTLLENEALRLEARGGPLWIAGTADATTRDPRVGQALAGVPAGDPVIVLSHDPDVFRYVPKRVALTLSGHTHGGQVDVPGLRERVIPSRFGTRYKAGHVVEHDRHLFVSRGIGTSQLPVRLGAPPEIPVLTLRS